ncbi:hypothetical protein ACHAXT_004990 [Thalassiosira profunda]
MKGAASTLLLLDGLARLVHITAEAALPTQQYIANRGLGEYGAHDSSDVVGRQLSTASAVSRSYPECWTASVASIGSWDIGGGATPSGEYPTRPHSSGSSYCAAMSSEEKDALALELTHCQLKKEQRPFFKAGPAQSPGTPADAELSAPIEESANEQLLCKVGSGEPYSSTACFPLMSDYAMVLYHKILIHTQDACARLTEERMMIQKEEVTQMLVYASSAVSNQMQDTVAAVREQTSQLLEEQASMMTEQRMEHERQSAEREAAAASAMERMASQTESMLEDQSSKMRAHRLETYRMHKEREEAAASAMEQMANRAASLLQNQAAALLAEQADKINEQKKDLERMQEMITTANTQMQPLSSIESYVRLATGGFTLLKSLLAFFVSMNVAWMLTAVPMLIRARRYLFVVFGLGLLAEVAVVWFADNPLVMEWGGVGVIETLRGYARAIAAITLAISFLASCFWPATKSPSSITMDELLKSQMELVAKLNASPQMQTSVERVDVPIGVGTREFSEERGRPRERFGREEQLVASSFRPGRRRSRSPYRSSSTELAMPVVTPVKPRPHSSARAALTANMPPTDFQTTYYVHRSDALARQEEEALRLELERNQTMQGSVPSGAAGRDTSDASSAKTGKKRTLSEMYTSSGEETAFYSANDDDMSVSSDRSDASEAEIQARKKSKVAKAY